MGSIQRTWFCAFYLAIPIVFVLHTVSVGGTSSLQVEESLELNEELKAIKTQYGDIYDCVELYKQPAFIHPLLKNHKIQMRPTITLQKKVSENSSSNSLTFGLKESCPSGTVPIRRTTMEDQLAAKSSFTQQFQGSSSANGLPLVFAGLSTVPDKFMMAAGYVSTHNPTVDMQQFSASVISIEHGPPEQFATIRVGWMVLPSLYHGDNHTRLYVLWGQFKDGRRFGCFNAYCVGFIQTHPKIPPDMVIENISGPEGQELYIFIGLARDIATGNWWFYYGDNKEPIGYWPPNLFLALKDGAEIVKWGGMVSSNSQKLPDMGSGQTGDQYGSHFRKLSGQYGALSSSLKFDGSENEPLRLVQTRCYKAGGNSYKSGDYWGYSFWFGGKGGPGCATM